MMDAVQLVPHSACGKLMLCLDEYSCMTSAKVGVSLPTSAMDARESTESPV